jgi:HopA1 effector protein family
MQTLDPISTTPVVINPELMAVLEDIARNVEIRDDFSIHHPSYKPLEIPAEAVERFQKMPEQMRQKFLSLQLRSFLYGIYYNGGMIQALALDTEEQPVKLDLENNTVLGIDMAFFQRLHESNCGTGYFEPGWTILREEDDGSLTVKGAGLRLNINREYHLQEADRQSTLGDIVAIRMPKNRMQSGFYMAVGNQGFSRLQPEGTLVRIYFNLTADGSVIVMKSLTSMLNEINLTFSFKVLYNPDDYNRFDSGVLYFNQQDYEAVTDILKQIHQGHQSHFVPKVPLFTKQIAIGLSVAEEPNQKFAERESFGMNRCQIVANGLLEAYYQEKNSVVERMELILESFALSEIDLQCPYLNSGSECLYHVVD